MRTIILALAAVTTFSAAIPTSQEFMEKMDSDDDGFITLREAVKNTDLLREFGDIDINEDGKISEAELISSDYGREVLSLSV
ncbi:calcium-binding protein [Alteromonas sp. ZYF713]|nr:calcium-binding protein [Alteromonas sp. ZYF713]